ncbi:MAG: hypothetical protein EOP83_06180 [Verrucomicrobiaceae bacterium]|nr:MAG: hypothetical protein EOP83_06180 [Verrucomicrobiaceae bacterium]
MSIPPIKVAMTTQVVTAKPRKLKGRWTLQMPSIPDSYPIYMEARYTEPDRQRELDDRLRHMVMQLGKHQEIDPWPGYQTPEEIIMFASLAESVAPDPIFSLYSFAETFVGLPAKTRNALLKASAPDYTDEAFVHEAFSYAMKRAYPHRLGVLRLDVDAFREEMIAKGIKGRIGVRYDDSDEISVFCNDPHDFTMVRLMF